jgi:hypothetical protein
VSKQHDLTKRSLKDTGQVTEVAEQLVHFSRSTFWEYMIQEQLHICKVMTGRTALLEGVIDQVNNTAKQPVHIYKSTLSEGIIQELSHICSIMAGSIILLQGKWTRWPSNPSTSTDPFSAMMLFKNYCKL